MVLGLETAEFAKGIRATEKSITQWGKKAQQVGRQMSDVGSRLTRALTLPLAGIATMAVKTGLEFEKSINQIEGVLRPTAQQMERVREVAMKMGADTVFSAKESADAILELGKAGFTTDQAIASVDKVLQLAAASGLSMADSASLAARTLQAFGLDVEELSHVNDVLAQAVNSTSLEIGDLQTAFGYVGPIARGFGMSIEQVSAALGIMRDNGVGAETAGRALRMGLTRLVNPTKSVKDAMKDLGIESFTSDGRLQGLGEIIDTLRGRGMSTAQAMKLFGQEAGPAMVALISQGRGALDSFTESLVNSDGAAKAMADAMMKGLPGAMERLRGSVETAWLAISKVIEPAVIRILDGLGSLADLVTKRLVPAFRSMPSSAQTAAIGLAGVAAAAGPVLWVTGELIQTFGVLARNVALLGTILRGTFVVGSLAALREWVKNTAEAELGVKRLSTELDELGRNASTFEKLKVITRHLNDGAMGATVAAELAVRWLGSARRDIELTGGATETAAKRTADAQKRLRESAAELDIQLSNLEASGRSSADMVTTMGASAAEAVEQAQRLGLSLSSLPPAVVALAEAFKRQNNEQRSAAGAADRKAEADKLAKQAADEAEEAARQQRDTYRSLGLITDGDVVNAITNYNEALEVAAKHGSGALIAATLVVIRKLEELRVQAQTSGLSTQVLDGEMQALSQSLSALPFPQLANTLFTDVLPAGKLVTASMLEQATAAGIAKRDADRLTAAFKYFGVETTTALDKTANEARQHFERVRDSGLATPEALKKAWDDLQVAERRGREQVIPIWRQYVDHVKGLLTGLGRAFTDQLVGIRSRLNEEKRRMADDARDAFARTERDATESVSRAQQQARSEYDRTADYAQQTYDRDIVALSDAAAQKQDKARGNAEAMKEIDIWYALERQRIDDEKNAALVAADKTMNDTITAAAEEANGKIAEAHAEMEQAIEAASHPWKDRMLEIWGALKSGVQDILSQMLSNFIGSFLGGMLQGLNGWAQKAGAIIGQVLGMGGGGIPGLGPTITSLTAPAAAGGGSAAAGAGAAGVMGTVGAFAAGAAAPFILGRLVNPGAGYRDQAAQASDAHQEFLDAAAYFGRTPEEHAAYLDIPSFEKGTNGRYFDFGAGTLAMLHGEEMVTPKGYGGGGGTAILEIDGRTFAEIIVPEIPGVVERYRLGFV